MVEVPLANGRGVALVDDEDADAVLARRWCLHSGGYAARNRSRRHPLGPGLILMHREILGLEAGDPLHTDHINHDRLDNRRSNIRLVTQAQNMQNVSATGGTSAHRGVGWHAKTRKWRAYAQLDGVLHHLGLYRDEEEAAAVAAAWRAEHMPYATA